MSALTDRWKQRKRVVFPRPQNVQMTMTHSMPIKSQALFFALQKQNRWQWGAIPNTTKSCSSGDLTRFCSLELEKCPGELNTYKGHWNIEAKAWRPWIIYKDATSTSRGLSSLIYFIQVAGMVGLTEEPPGNAGFRQQSWVCFQERSPRPEFSPLSCSTMSETSTITATPSD